jgi:hypothetical protein
MINLKLAYEARVHGAVSRSRSDMRSAPSLWSQGVLFQILRRGANGMLDTFIEVEVAA